MGVVQIKEMDPQCNIEGQYLKGGVIYRGSDGLLYLGVNEQAYPNLQAYGIGHDHYVDNLPGGEEILFRELNVIISVEL